MNSEYERDKFGSKGNWLGGSPARYQTGEESVVRRNGVSSQRIGQDRQTTITQWTRASCDSKILYPNMEHLQSLRVSTPLRSLNAAVLDSLDLSSSPHRLNHRPRPLIALGRVCGSGIVACYSAFGRDGRFGSITDL